MQYVLRPAFAPYLDRPGPDVGLVWSALCRNPRAISLLEAHPEKIDIAILCSNPSPAMLPLLERVLPAEYLRPDNTYIRHITRLSINVHAVPLLERYPHLIHWSDLCTNPAAVHIVQQNMDRVVWHSLCANPSTAAVAILARPENVQHIEWVPLCGNPCPDAIALLTQHMAVEQLTPMHLRMLSSNPCPAAVAFMAAHWPVLSRCNGVSAFFSSNPCPDAFPLFLQQDPDGILWHVLCENRNPAVIALVERHLAAVDSQSFANDDRAVPENQHYIRTMFASSDYRSPPPNHWSLPLLADPVDVFCKADWSCLSANPAAAYLFVKYPHFVQLVQWDYLVHNHETAVLPLLETHLPHMSDMQWYFLSANPSIFEPEHDVVLK